MADRDQDLRALEAELGLPEGFYDRLRKDDDWSFVIKLHALFESATTYVLARALARPELEEPLSYIEMSNKRSGKVALGKALALFDEEERRFLYQLSELRNHLVHRIDNVSFSFEQHVQSMDAQQRKKFHEAFGYSLKDPIQTPEFTVPRNQFVLENPKISIWLSGMELLSMLYLHKETALLRQQHTSLALKALEQLIPSASLKVPHAP